MHNRNEEHYYLEMKPMSYLVLKSPHCFRVVQLNFVMRFLKRFIPFTSILACPEENRLRIQHH